MPSAKKTVKNKYPYAECVRGMFGVVVYADDTHSKMLSQGRAYWNEEAWIEAAEKIVSSGCGE